MNAKQAKALPVGMQIALSFPGHPLVRGTVTENDPKTSGGFFIKWDDGEKGWIDYRDARDVFVPGLAGTRRLR